MYFALFPLTASRNVVYHSTIRLNYSTVRGEFVRVAKKEIKPWLGARLSKFIKEQELTQAEFARQIGYSGVYISDVVRGKKPVSESLAKQIEKTFGDYAIRWEWLTGISAYKTKRDEINATYLEPIEAFRKLVEAVGFNTRFKTGVNPVTLEIESPHCYWTVAKAGDATVEFSEQEFDALVEHWQDYAVFLMERVYKTKAGLQVKNQE